jgi:phosphoenolpyruvate carboxylase
MVHYLQKKCIQRRIDSKCFDKDRLWPGGDRDGNPFVTTEITLNAERLRTSTLKCYYIEIRIKRKLTFNVDVFAAELEHKLYRSVFIHGKIYIT